MITLNLLHPLQSVPIQNWTFEEETLIRIGRATDNDVILYSAVVSRYHVELRRQGSDWEVINLGANGTYLEGKRISEAPIKDGAMIRLARSGPQIQILLGASNMKEGQKTASRPLPTEPKPDKSRDTLIYPKAAEKGDDATQMD